MGASTWTTVDNYAAHWDGYKWTKEPLPGVPQDVSAVSPNDIWLLSLPVKGGAEFLSHWNGKKWAPVALPKVTVPKGYSLGGFESLAAFGDKDLWAQESISKKNGGQPAQYLVHWNGSTWSRITFKYPTDGVEDIKSDGSGGVWLWAYSAAKGNPLLVYHVHGSSQSEYSTTLPSDESLWYPEWIPGSSAAWAVAEQWSTPAGNPPVYALILKGTI
jgi:hypothetical protein